ncbi:hypothetical protein L7E55_16935 [Pelotomaculum isophthalicicum JI]|uniref:Uncharacterized protein n=1 Tax=Pelotomaculum isophthalicicum JI TaxID=947010 RepID=A0A9X4H9C4_9FIRM|nr:hypothetical protein [Pelotomaculum isophthalicicum]MDF9410009.1 hypothetical protein [Pelotomaculum isophthalicicum JI]
MSYTRLEKSFFINATNIITKNLWGVKVIFEPVLFSTLAEKYLPGVCKLDAVDTGL